MAAADVVVTCRGLGRPTLTAPALAEVMRRRGGAPLVLVDLAVSRDVEPEAAGLPGVVLLDLPTIQLHVPDASQRELARARASSTRACGTWSPA